MARPLRIELEGGLYHVTSRGIARHRIFRDDADCRQRLEWLRQTVEVYGWRLHAFALLANHDHLLVETPRANLSAGMQFLNGSYTSDFNRRHRRASHLFQGRYKAVLIEQEGHYREVSRHIHLGPVLAQLAQRPEQWPWSSYAGYHSLRGCLPWITYDRVLAEFGPDAVAARRAYRRFVAEGLDHPLDNPLAGAVHGWVLGSKRFVRQVGTLLRRRAANPAAPRQRQQLEGPAVERIIELVAAHFHEDASRWQGGRRNDLPGRAVAAYLARRRFGHSATRTATALGYADASGVTQAIRRVEVDLGGLNRTLERLERQAADQ